MTPADASAAFACATVAVSLNAMSTRVREPPMPHVGCSSTAVDGGIAMFGREALAFASGAPGMSRMPVVTEPVNAPLFVDANFHEPAVPMLML